MHFTISFKDLFNFKTREEIKKYIIEGYGIKYYNLSLKNKILVLDYWIKLVGYA